jgi:hypothetical protein
MNGNVRASLLASVLFLSGAGDIALAQSPQPFNSYVLAAVSSLATSSYAGKGYAADGAFTHDLPYADQCCVHHTPAPPAEPKAPKTMCVATVEEVILTALQAYYAEDPAHRGAELAKAPLGLWDKGTLNSLKANLFLYDQTGSRGTGDTLQRFNMGIEKHFSELVPGDFINLNRKRSGHAVVFLNYIDAHDQETSTYSTDVIGFRYFSSQGEGKPLPVSGLGYRWAYFEGICPDPKPGRLRDCGVIRSNNLSLLDGGTLYFPEDWHVKEALAAMRQHARGAFSQTHPGLRGAALESSLDQVLSTELPAPNANKYQEPTTD